MTLRRAHERYQDLHARREVWRTFDPKDTGDALAEGFGALEILDEDRLGPGQGEQRAASHDAEIITYVRDGALAHEDSTGRSGVIQTGEFRRLSIARGVRHSETNASPTDWAHVFHIRLHTRAVGLASGHEQKRFCTADRRGLMCIVASADGQKGSLRIHQDALVYSVLLEPGQHVIHELAPGRRAWLHVVQGDVTLGDLVLTTGDGAGLTAERAVSLTAREDSEFLLVDLAEPLPPLGVRDGEPG